MLDLIPKEILDYILYLTHLLEIRDNRSIFYGIREQVEILWSGRETICVYLHPREMQLEWEGRYEQIPEEQLYDLRRTMTYLIKNFFNEDFESYKDSAYQNHKNLYIFYHAWDIPGRIKQVQESKKILKAFYINGEFLDPSVNK